MTAPVLTRILYAEDEPDIAAVAKLALEMVGGRTVEICKSGEAALARVPVFAPDLVLLDMMIPGLDGPSTLQVLRNSPSTAAIPVAFMTAKVQPHEIDCYRNLGAVGVIAKPFDPMTLADQVRRLWANHHARSAG